jgi:hypothetical protein
VLDQVKERFSKHNLTSRVVLPNAHLPGSDYLFSPPFVATNHIPFFYILGTAVVSVKTVFCLNPGYGLELAAFLRGCKANRVVASGHIFPYAGKNVRAVGGSLEMSETIPQGQFDVALILGERDWPESRDVLLDVWGKMSDNSLIIVDYIQTEPVGRGWEDLGAVTNRPGVVFPTRHGTGVMIR